MPTKQNTNIDESAEWESIIKQSKDAPNILPKLNFGQKGTEGRVVVVIEDDQPRFATFKDKFNQGKEKRAMFLNVKCIESTIASGDVGGMRSLPMSADPQHSLTRGVTTIAKRHNNRLKGVCIVIELRNYTHKEFGLTRGYTVTEREALPA